ncbi:MAG: putative Ig domain-containing protein, partial [Rivularia sp. (in: cyanobacteria)]
MAGSDIFNNGGLGESLIDSANLGAPLDDSSSLLGVSKEIKETASGAEPVEKELESLTKKNGAESGSNDEENSTVNRFEQPTLFNQQPYIPPVPYRNNVDDADFLTGESGDGTKVNFSAFDSLSNNDGETVATPLKFSQAESNLELSTILANGGNIKGRLSITDDNNPTREGRYKDDYQLTDTTPGRVINIELSGDFDEYIQLINTDTQEEVASNDDGVDGNNSLLTFTPKNNINYLVRVTSYSELETGDYTLKTREFPAVSVGNTVSKENYPDSLDDYKHEYQLLGLKAGEVVEINLTSEQFDTYLYLKDPDNQQGRYITSDYNSGNGTNSRIVLVPNKDISYLLEVVDVNGDKLENYSLKVNNLPALTANGGLVENANLSIEDANHPNNSDYYISEYQLTNFDIGDVYNIKLSSDDFDTELQIIDANNLEEVVIEDYYNSAGGNSSYITFIPKADTNYILRVSNYNDEEDKIGKYSLSSTKLPTLSPGDSLPKLSSNGILIEPKPTLSKDDLLYPYGWGNYYSDAYQLEDLKTGEIVGIDFLSSEFKGFITIYNLTTDEEIVYKYTDKNIKSRLTFAPEENSTYILRVTSYNEGELGDYALDLNNLTKIYPSGSSFKGELSNIDANFGNGEDSEFVDDYQLTNLESGSLVKIEANSNEFKTYVEVVDVDSNNTIVDSNNYPDKSDSSDNSSYIIFSPASNTNYVIRISNYEDESENININEPLNYNIKVSSTLNPEISGEGSTIPGTLNADDYDAYTGAYTDDFTLTDITVGQPIKIQLDSEEFNTQLELVNTDTQEVIYYIDKSDDIYNSQLAFIPLAGINYTVRVASYYGEEEIVKYELKTQQINIPTFTFLNSPLNNLNGELTSEDVINLNPKSKSFESYSKSYQLEGFKKGKTYLLSLSSEDENFDGYVELVNAANQEIIYAGNDDFTYYDSSIIFTPQQNIDYLLRVSGEYSDSLGTYRVDFTEIPEVSVLGHEESYLLSDTDNYYSNYDGDYKDVYKITDTSPGRLVRIKLTSTEFNTYLEIVDLNNPDNNINYYAFDSQDSDSEFIFFSPDINANYLIKVSSDNYPTRQGEYSLSVEEIPIFDFKQQSKESNLNANTDAYEGSVFDYYQLNNFKEGELVVVNALSNNFENELTLYNADTFEQLASVEGDYIESGSRLFFIPKSDINYFVEISGYNGTESEEYTLSTSKLEIFSIKDNNFEKQLSEQDLYNPSRRGRFSDDYELIDFKVGKLLTLKLTSDNIDTLEPSLEVIEVNEHSQKSLISNKTDEYDFTQLSFIPQQGKKYIVRISSYEKNQTGGYKLTAIESPSVLPSIKIDNSLTEQQLTQNDLANPDDFNKFIKDYELDLSGFSENRAVSLYLDATFDGYLEIFDAKDIVEPIYKVPDPIYEDDDSGSNKKSTEDSRIIFIPEAGKNYIARVTSSRYRETGGFELKFDSLPIISAVNDSKNGKLDDTDFHYSGRNSYYTDTYQLTNFLPEELVTIDLSANLSDSSLTSEFGLELRIVDEKFSEIDYSYDYGSSTNASISFIPERNKEYFVRINSYSTSEPVSYNLKTNTSGTLDLIVTDNHNAPSTVILDEEFDVSWEVENTGDIEVSPDWKDYIYLSTDDKYDSRDELIASFNTSSKTFVDSKYQFNEKITITDYPSVSDINELNNLHLIFVTDRNNNQPENNDNNNYETRKISLQVADLEVEEVKINSTDLYFGQTFNVDWDLKNSGTADVTGIWEHKIWLSNDDGDTLLTTFIPDSPITIAAKTKTQLSTQVNLDSNLTQQIGEGNYRIIVKTDTDNELSEFNESNNSFTSGIVNITEKPIPLPDLEIRNVVVDEKAQPNDNISISWDVYNIGDANASGTWTDEVYLVSEQDYNSITNTNELLTKAVSQKSFTHTADTIQPLQLTPVNNYLFTLPSDIADGDYRIVVVTDSEDKIYEGTKENNNRGVSTGKLTVGRVDLSPKIIEVDTNPTSGDNIILRWEVTNNGSSPTSGTWVDRVYLSKDSPDIFSPNTSDFEGEIVHEAGLTSQQKYPGEIEIDLPLDISGERYLYVITDAANNIGELDNTGNAAEENTVYQQLQIELADYADLAVSDITVTEDTIGNPATISVNWKVTNIGTGAGKTDKWEDRIIASVDDDITNGNGVTDDIVIATFLHTGLLDANSSNPDNCYYTKSEDIQLPPGFEGKYNLYVETGFSSIFENGLKDNNLDKAEKQFFVAPREYSDLIVTDVQTEVTTAETGETVKLTWTVENQGRTVTNTNSWSDSVVLYKLSYDSENKEVLEAVYSQRYDRIGALSNIGGSNTYTRAVNIQLPLNLKAGNYYFEVTTGKNNSNLYESIYNNNNNKNNKEKQIAITPSPAPDLTVNKIIAIDKIQAGEKIDITWEILNKSTKANAIGSWVDEVYLKNRQDSSTIYLGSFTYNNDVGAGKNYQRTETFKIGERIQGLYDIVVETNTTKSLYEVIDKNNSSENNQEINSNSLLINLPDRPDLQIDNGSLKVPDVLAAGNTIPKNSIEFTVVNRGTVAATGTWTDKVFLSLDKEISGDDIFIGSFINGAALQPLNTNNSSNISDKKDSYRTVVTESFDIPKYLRGEAYIIVQADANNQIDEYPKDEINKLAQKVQIESLKPSDLVTSNVKVINEAFEGSEIKVSYKVTNQGVEETDRDRWTDSVWLTTEPNRRPQAELGDILLDNFTRNGGLQTSNDSIDVINYYENEVTVTIPNQVSGNYYITVWSDSNEEVTEDTFSNNSNLDNSDTTNNPQNEIDFNNFSSRPILVKLQPSPDLTVSNIEIDEIPNPKAGELFKVTWKVDNITDIATEEDYWYDEVYISDKPTLDDKDAKKWYIGRYQRSGKLNAREGYTGELETVLSPGVQGKYIIVKTNAGKNAWESVYTNNNEKNLQQDITTTQSDLEVIGIEVKPIEADNNNYSGDATKIEWTVRNNGEPVWEGTRYWYDEIWISDNPVFNKDQSTKIGFVPYSPTEQFGKGDIYINSTEVVLPPGYDGEYFIHVSTNLSHDKNTSRFNGSLPEKGNNELQRKSFEYRVHEDISNNLNQTFINVTYREADLIIDNVKYSEIDQISGVQSGETIEVTWDVINDGTRDTRENIWYDRIYLSQDGSLDRSDVYLGKYKREGILQIDDKNPDNGVEINSYQGKARITLPEGINGDYQLLVFTDSNLVETPRVPNIGFEGLVDRRLARVPEFDDEDNNIASESLSVTLRPSADLQVTNVKINADNSKAIAGQSFTIDYTVKNVDEKGDTPQTQQKWTDLIYLSRDKYLDLNKDIFLKYVDHEGGLKAGESYTVENETLQIPLNLAGLYNNVEFNSASYYVFVVTDPTKTNLRGKVYEGENENNNDKHSDEALIIERPKEVDLVVDNSSINVKNQGSIVRSGNVGDKVEISWKVKNESENSTSVNWSDAVYLSKDNDWDINDTLLGYYQYNQGLLAANSDYEAKITTFLPALTPTDDYRIIIRNDVYNQVWEGFDIGEKNNVVFASNQLEINAESLQLNVLEENISLGKEQERLYEIDVKANQTLRITLNGEEAAFNEIFVRYKEAPSGVEYDAASTGIIGAKQTATVSNTKAGKYYVLVRTVEGNSNNVNLIAEELPFGVTDVVTDRGGDSRYVTTNIYGAQFQEKAVVKLVRPGIAEYIPVNYKVIDNTHIQAIFDLTNAPHGLYDVKVINPNGEEAVLPYRYLVERAIEKDVRIGLGGPRIIAPGEVGTYGVSLESLTNVDTPYVHFQFGIPELGENKLLSLLSDFLVPDSQRKDLNGLPYVQFTSNLRGEPDGDKLSDDVWASIKSDVNLDGRILAPGYVVDLPNAGYVDSTFNAHVYPGLQELLEQNPDLLESISDEDIAFKFNILATATVMNRDEFIAEQTSEALKLRENILNDETASTALINLASNQETWTNSYLAALESAGLLRPEDGIPPIRENTKVISLMATLASGLLLGPAGDSLITNGDLVTFFSKVREWYGHNPNLEAGNDIPDLNDFDKELTQVTHSQAFNVYVPFRKARVDLPPTVDVPRPSFDKFFNVDGVNNELASITGPIGYGEENFIPLNAQLPYTINFETSSTSTSAVGEVRIVSKLDDDLDPRTFQLGDLRLGDIEVNIPTGRGFFQGEFDFSQSKGFNLRISAGLEIETKTVTWLIQAIDPKTGEIIQNPDIGLLLPNTEENIGSGFVSYTVLPSADIETGAVINSSARVFYNNAAPIDTAETINIADGTAPETRINVRTLGEQVNGENSNYESIQKIEGGKDYLVSWKSNDDSSGSGIKHITVYVAENGGDFKIWQRQTTDTEAVFSGKADSSYEFLALATDNAGNTEQPVLGINAPSDGSTVNLGNIPIVAQTSQPEIAPPPKIDIPSTNELFIEARKAEIPTNLSDNNKPEFDKVLRPFTAESFVTNIQQSQGEVGAMAIAILDNGDVIASGGSNRGSLYRFDREGGGSSSPFAILEYPVFDLALDKDGFLWGVTGGASLIKLDPQTGEIIKEYGDSITTGLAINSSSGLIYVASGNGIEVFNPETEEFTHYSDIRVDNLAINPSDKTLWATTYPKRGNVISFDEDGKATLMVEYDSPIDSIAFGKPDSQLKDIIFVSDNSGKLHMVDTASLESITIAEGGSRGEIVETTPDGKVLVAQSNQIDIFNPVLSPDVKAINPAPGSTVALPQGKISITFDTDMFEGDIHDANSVFNPNNYQLIDIAGNIINPLSVRYDNISRTALLEFNGIDAGEHKISILPSLESSAGLKMEDGYNAQFTAISNFSDLVEFKFDNPRSNRQNQTVSYDVTITNTSAIDLQLPLMLVLDPAQYFNGEVIGAIGENRDGAFLVDLQDSLDNGTLKAGKSITNRTITVFNPDAYRVELAPGIYTLPYPNAAPTITSNPVVKAIANTEYNYQILAKDSDGVEFGYLLENAPEGMSVSENGLITWNPTEESAVNTKVELYVFDKRGGYTKQEFTINVTGGNNKPVFNNLSIITGASITTQNNSFQINAKEAQTLQLQLSAKDTDNNKLTYWADNLPPGAVFDAKTGILTWTPGNSSAGTYENVEFTVTDGKERIVQTATFLVEATNQLPTFKTIPDKFVREGESVRIQLKANDAEGDNLTYSSKLLPGGSKLDPNSGLFEWTPAYFQAGDFEIPFIVSDGESIVTQTAFITVSNANAAPIFENIDKWYVQEGQQLRFRAFAFDPDNPDFVPQERNADGELTILEGSLPTVNYTVNNLPDGAIFDKDTAIFSWTPDFYKSGNYNVTFTATDDGDGTGFNATSSITIPITVYNTNRAPEIAEFENISLNKGDNQEFTIQVTDAENDDLRLSLIREREAGFGIPDFIDFVDNGDGTAKLKLSPTDKDISGSYTFTLIAEEIREENDSETPLYTEKTFNINILGNNDAPQIEYIGDKVAVVGETLKFDVEVNDNNQDNLTFEILNKQDLPSGITLTPKFQYGKATFEWKLLATDVDILDKVYPVTIRVTDSGNGTDNEIFSDIKTFNIVVRNSNTAPQLNPIPNLSPEGIITIKEAETFTLKLSATDSDNDTITYLAKNLPQNASLDAKTGLLTWKPNYSQAGLYENITIIATDGNLQSEQIFSIEVENTNRSPVIIPLPTQTARENERLIFNLNAVDYDVEGVVFSPITDLPEGATFDTRTGVFNWKPDYNQAGQYKLTFEVKDAAGAIGERDVNILITDTNRNPEFTVSNRGVALGETLNFRLNAIDLDENTQFTYTADI